MDILSVDQLKNWQSVPSMLDQCLDDLDNAYGRLDDMRTMEPRTRDYFNEVIVMRLVGLARPDQFTREQAELIVKRINKFRHTTHYWAQVTQIVENYQNYHSL